MEKLNAKWYAMYTKPGFERKVANLLTKKKIEHYCPIYQVQPQSGERRKNVLEPLFKSYVFIRTEEQHLNTALNTHGVINFIYWLNRPAEIDGKEIDIIKKILNDYEQVYLEKTSVSQNGNIKMVKGSLVGKEGNLTDVWHNSVEVVLPSLGYALKANSYKSQAEHVKIITPSSKPASSILMKFNSQ